MLSDMKIKNFKPMEKFYKVTDGDGLYVHVSETGSKSFRYRYRFNGKQKVLTFGMYPYISLSDARKMKEDAKGQLAHGIDPNAAKRAFKQEEITEKETFELIAREWLGKFSANWSDGYADRILSSFERDVFPFIGTTPIKSVNAPLLLTVLRRIESRGALDTAHRVRGNVGMVLRYGVATGRCERDCTGDLKGALPPAIEQHMAAITEPKKLGELLRAIDAYKGSEHVKAALKLAPMLFVRPLNLRSMKWEDVNLDTAEWNIPGAEMKMRDAHLVPLATQAVSILETLKEFTGNYKYCFPHFRDIK
ncbi:MAG: integrase arm-type DNA-binding domain-containing protein, partial [Smithella sp.]